MRTLIIGFLISLLFGHLHADIKIQNAWVKNAPPVVPVRAAYFTLVNDSNDKVVIKTMSSPQFNMVEAHATVYKDNVYSMHPLHNLYIAPNSTLTLEPKGKHLMLMMPVKPLSGIKTIELNLTTHKNKTIKINAPIKD